MKTVEEIRYDRSGKNQTDFAAELGISLRTYHDRIKGDQRDWKIYELIVASRYDEGQVKVTIDDVDYYITIQEG